DLQAARERRAQADAQAASGSPSPASAEQATTAGVSPTEDTLETPLDVDTPLEAYLFDDPATPASPAERTPTATPSESAPTTEPQIAPEPEAESQPATKPRRSSRRKRASVPSWDEIMFGGGKSE
ncbi:MAG: septation protein SepH, partial [Nocardioides sp.]|uniref:septation protein SepH n=1 Tax=Nocardioides sp. TaxID=35761 RepID=UPI0039E32A46